MRLFLFAGVFSLGLVHVAHAQSLDIGGIELHLGQQVEEALRSLSSYQVQHNEGSWFVTQRVGNKYEFLGTISAKANVITFISKLFNLEENENTPVVYSRASKELRRRGGTPCFTREVEYTDGLIREIETQCGQYKLSYHLPSKTADGTPVRGGLSILIRKP